MYKRQGTVTALSSPRLTVMNNQSAVMNVAVNRVYFTIDTDTSQSDTAVVTTFNTEPNYVPEGVLINVQPSIDRGTDTVSMAIRPTITRRVGDGVNDPNPALLLPSTVPEIGVQEFESVVRLHSGQTVVLGGLMQDQVSSGQNGVPVLSEVPLLGGLFRDHTDTIAKTELVVFLKATILKNGDTGIHDTDKDLYRTFSSDRRPFQL